jgi:DNA uptake protein ComE-like DNA-binding protein
MIVGYALWSTPRNEAVTFSELGVRTTSQPVTVRSEQGDPVEPRVGGEAATPSWAVEATSKNLHPSASQASSQSLVDLNDSSERELAALPGIGVILAKRAVGLRKVRGGFRSVEDFGEALNRKPHVVERIRPLVSVSPPVQRPQRPDSPGRVVDY